MCMREKVGEVVGDVMSVVSVFDFIRGVVDLFWVLYFVVLVAGLLLVLPSLCNFQ